MKASTMLKEATPNKQLRDEIDCLKKLVTNSLAELHADLDKLRYYFKADISEVKSSIQKLEDSIEFTQGEVDTLKEQVKEKSKKHATDVELLLQKFAELELKLKDVEHNTNLEQHTRRENLRANFPGDRVKSEKMWHVLGKSTTFIFCSEIPFGESINVANFFCSNLFFFSKKYSKTITSADRHKMTETKATSMATITLLLRSAKVSRPFSNLDIC